MTDCLAVFDTTYETLRAEDFFREQGVKFRPVLRPRGVGSSACRMALRFPEEEVDKVKRAVVSGNLTLHSYYRLEGDAWARLE